MVESREDRWNERIRAVNASDGLARTFARLRMPAEGRDGPTDGRVVAMPRLSCRASGIFTVDGSHLCR